MSDSNTDDEPTMEEILASIRQIISDDSAEESDAQPGESDLSAQSREEEPEEDAVEPSSAAEEPADEAEDFAEEDPFLETVTPPEPEPVKSPPPPPPPPPPPVREPEPFFDEEDDDVFELTDIAVPRSGPIDPLVSPPIENQAAISFSHLSEMMVAGYDGADNTLEALVRAMLKPMLQAWLDENLPSIVQDAVEREVARISRRK